MTLIEITKISDAPGSSYVFSGDTVPEFAATRAASIFNTTTDNVTLYRFTGRPFANHPNQIIFAVKTPERLGS